MKSLFHLDFEEVRKINLTILQAILLLLSWFVIGLIGTVLMILEDMRGEEYDENYFTGECKMFCGITVTLGYLTLCIVIVYYIVKVFQKNKPITKILYKIANTKINKKSKN